MPAAAQTIEQTSAPSAATVTLQPFTAQYDLYVKGKLRGDATMSLVQQPNNVMTFTLDGRVNKGMASMAGFRTRMVTTFVPKDGQLRMLKLSYLRKHVFNKNEFTTTYDHQTNQAISTGDIDDHGAASIALPANASNLHVLSMRVGLDWHHKPQKTLDYAIVSKGRSFPLSYQFENAQPVELPIGTVLAEKGIAQRPDEQGEDWVWYSKQYGVIPLRMTQIREGDAKVDFRLKSVTMNAAPKQP